MNFWACLLGSGLKFIFHWKGQLFILNYLFCNTDYNSQWSIKVYASPYKFGTRKCDLCLIEKMVIARSDPQKCSTDGYRWFLNVDIGTNFYWATSNKTCCIIIKRNTWDSKTINCFWLHDGVLRICDARYLNDIH